MSLDPYVVIEYIKSSVDIILNLKFEEIEKRLLDKTTAGHEHTNDIKEARSSIISDHINRESYQNRKKLLDHHRTNSA